MSRKKILHVLFPDNFTVPFMKLLNQEFDSNEHVFLCVFKPEENIIESYPNIVYLKTRYRKNLIRNTIIVLNWFLRSSKIIMHGNPILFYFFLFPFVLKKTYWIIYGMELNTLSAKECKTFKLKVNHFIKFYVLKRVFGHISHIKGDSELANSLFKSKAKFFYSPMYLSNVVDNIGNNFSEQHSVVNILVGNSTSPSNYHEDIFRLLLPYKEDNIKIYCPLSYGANEEYKEFIIKAGTELFGNKFVPITYFIHLNEYLKFLEIINVAIFNHKRQEAMGVTLALLAMGKTVYMNKETTSFKSFIERGICVFDVEQISNGGIFLPHNVGLNAGLLNKYYSRKVLLQSMREIFED